MSRNASVLDAIVAAKRATVDRLTRDAAQLRAQAEAMPPARDFRAALDTSTVAVIAEFKRRSPSAGWIHREADVKTVLGAYADAGVSAFSVLTDEEFFGGSLGDLAEARKVARLPILRKDFLIDPVQVWEARAAGADAILLIVRILDDAQLRDLRVLAEEAGMHVLVEVHTAEEVERALGAGARIVGINSRDLANFRTDLGLVLELARAAPEEVILVGESGIRTPEDIEHLATGAGVDAVLIGETLMRAGSTEAVRAFTTVTRRPRVGTA